MPQRRHSKTPNKRYIDEMLKKLAHYCGEQVAFLQQIFEVKVELKKTYHNKIQLLSLHFVTRKVLGAQEEK